MALLELKGITAGYGQNVILRDFNLNVERGEFVSLLGSSGCGKTTTLRMIAGFSEPMQGTISFDGRDIPMCRCTSAISVSYSRAMRSFRT